MHQLLSSIFDAVCAVALLVGVPAAALHPQPATIALAGSAAVLLTGRVVTERAKAARS